MMHRLSLLLQPKPLFFFAFALLLSACQPTVEESDKTATNQWTELEADIQYQHFPKGDSAQIQPEQVLALDFAFYDKNTGDFFNTFLRKDVYYYLNLDDSSNYLQQILVGKTLKDSIHGKGTAASLYQGQLPKSLKASDTLFFDLKVQKIIDEQKEIQAFIQQQELSQCELAGEIYLCPALEKKAALQEGDSVHFEYRTWDIRKNQPLHSEWQQGKFRVGTSRVISGWNMGIPQIGANNTTTTWLLLPSALAYGAKGRANQILPYTPLAFEVKAVKKVGR